MLGVCRYQFASMLKFHLISREFELLQGNRCSRRSPAVLQIAECYSVWFAIVNTKSQWTILIRHKYNEIESFRAAPHNKRISESFLYLFWSNFFAVTAARYRALWTGRMFSDVAAIRCFAYLMRPRCQFCMSPNSDSNHTNASLRALYLLRILTSFRQFSVNLVLSSCLHVRHCRSFEACRGVAEGKKNDTLM